MVKSTENDGHSVFWGRATRESHETFSAFSSCRFRDGMVVGQTGEEQVLLECSKEKPVLKRESYKEIVLLCCNVLPLWPSKVP